MGILILSVVIACIVSAIFYRAGGQGSDPASKPTWMPMWLRDGKTRDAGCPLVLIGLSMLIWGISENWWAYLLCFGMSWGMLTTYWDWLFGYDNFYMHGFGCGVAAFWLAFCGIPLSVLFAHLIICTLGMGLWSQFIGTDYIEEYGRGVFFIL